MMYPTCCMPCPKPTDQHCLESYDGCRLFGPENHSCVCTSRPIREAEQRVVEHIPHLLYAMDQLIRSMPHDEDFCCDYVFELEQLAEAQEPIEAALAALKEARGDA